MVPPGQGDPVELEKAPPPLDPRPPSPAWGLSGTACGREPQQPGQDPARGAGIVLARSRGARWADGGLGSTEGPGVDVARSAGVGLGEGKQSG